MPHIVKKPNQTLRDKAIKISALSGLSFYMKFIGGSHRISHFEIALRFGHSNPVAACDALDQIAALDGYAGSVVREGFLRWADADAFELVMSRLNLHGVLADAVLVSLAAQLEVAV